MPGQGRQVPLEIPEHDRRDDRAFRFRPLAGVELRGRVVGQQKGLAAVTRLLSAGRRGCALATENQESISRGRTAGTVRDFLLNMRVVS